MVRASATFSAGSASRGVEAPASRAPHDNRRRQSHRLLLCTVGPRRHRRRCGRRRRCRRLGEWRRRILRRRRRRWLLVHGERRRERRWRRRGWRRRRATGDGRWRGERRRARRRSHGRRPALGGAERLYSTHAHDRPTDPQTMTTTTQNKTCHMLPQPITRPDRTIRSKLGPVHRPPTYSEISSQINTTDNALEACEKTSIKLIVDALPVNTDMHSDETKAAVLMAIFHEEKSLNQYSGDMPSFKHFATGPDALRAPLRPRHEGIHRHRPRRDPAPGRRQNLPGFRLLRCPARVRAQFAGCRGRARAAATPLTCPARVRAQFAGCRGTAPH